MKHDTLLRSPILIPFFSFFLSCFASEAMDEDNKKGDNASTQKRYFYRMTSQDGTKPPAIGSHTVDKEPGEEGDTLRPNLQFDQEGEVKEEKVYRRAGYKKRSKSTGLSIPTIKPGNTARKSADEEKDKKLDASQPLSPGKVGRTLMRNLSLKKKEKEDSGEPLQSGPIKETHISFNSDVPLDDSFTASSSSHDENPKPPGRQRSWGRNPTTPLQTGAPAAPLPLTGSPTLPLSPREVSNPKSPREYSLQRALSSKKQPMPKHNVKEVPPEGSENSVLLYESGEGAFHSSEQNREPYQPAFIRYNENSQLMKIIDEMLLRRTPWGVMAFQVFGALLFAMPSPTPMAAIAINVTGNIVDIPPGGWLSNTLVWGSYMPTLTFATLMQGSKWGKVMGQATWQMIKNWCPCYEEKERVEKALSVPSSPGGIYFWKIGREKFLPHYAINTLAFIASFDKALIPIALLSQIWSQHFSELIIPFSVFLLFRNIDQYYTDNTISFRIFFKYFLNQEPKGGFFYQLSDNKSDELENHFLQEIAQNSEPAERNLLLGIKQFQVAMKEDNVAKEAYQIISAEYDIINSLSPNLRKKFAASALLYKTIENEKGESMTRRAAIDGSYFSKLENSLGYMKTLYNCTKICMQILCKGGSTLISTPIIREFALEIFWTQLMPGSPNIKPLSYGFTLFFSILNLIREGPNLIKECNKLIEERKAIEKYDLRKLSPANIYASLSFNGTVSFCSSLVPSGLCTLIGVSLGSQSLDRWGFSEAWKAVMLTPFVINEFSPEFKFLKDNLKDFMTSTVTTLPETATRLSEYIVECLPELKSCCGCFSNYIPECASLYRKRSWLGKWTNDLKGYVKNSFDSVTNVVFYFTTQQEGSGQSVYEQNVGHRFNSLSDEDSSDL